MERGSMLVALKRSMTGNVARRDSPSPSDESSQRRVIRNPAEQCTFAWMRQLPLSGPGEPTTALASLQR